MTLPKEERMRVIERAHDELNTEVGKLLRYIAYMRDRLNARGVPLVPYDTWKKDAS